MDIQPTQKVSITTVHQIPSKFYPSLHLRVTIKFSRLFYLSLVQNDKKCYPTL